MSGGRVVVIGVGNEFRRDDAAGIAVVERLRHDPPAGAALCTSDGEPTGLLEMWAGARLAVVIDAVRAVPSRPGRIHALDLGRVVRDDIGAAGTHALGLGVAVALGRAVDRLPRLLRVYAIEGADFGFGSGLTPVVAAAVDDMARRVREIVAGAGTGLPAAPAAGPPDAPGRTR